MGMSNKYFLIGVYLLVLCTPLSAEGFTDLTKFLVSSDGTYSLGNNMVMFNNTRDSGTKIVFFDRDIGDNASAGAYWWDGSQIIDSVGNPTDSEGRAYGTDPLHPNETAIKAFKYPQGLTRNTKGDPRLRTHKHMFGSAAAGYPDWYLFKRGQRHDYFDGQLDGGKSDAEPMVVAAYGDTNLGRANIYPDPELVLKYDGEERKSGWPFNGHTGGDSVVWFHQVLHGLELHGKLGHLGAHTAVTHSGTYPYWLIEDCKLVQSSMVYMPRNTIVRRSISGFRWQADSHNQGYYTSSFKSGITFDEVIFYKNGYKTDPLINADPRRDIYSRNIYQGGGAQMGHIYRNIISADGASGGPQMRLGGTCENSLIIEGYWFSSTRSNHAENDWMIEGQQTGQSALVRNNVQFIYGYPTVNDPDTDDSSDNRAQPFWGYSLQGASFNSVVEGNIISGVMFSKDLGMENVSQAYGIKLGVNPDVYQDGNTYTQQNNSVRNNIIYKTSAGLALEGDWSGVSGNRVENNVFVSRKPYSDRNKGAAPATVQLNVTQNRFYISDTLADQTLLGEGNTILEYQNAGELEEWSDPERTLKQYVTEVLGLTLLDWEDDPWLNPTQVGVRMSNGESYDPMGLKTFMAVAYNMRNGGSDAMPSGAKPSWIGDYPWDTRFTAAAVVSWVREGFNLPSVMDHSIDSSDSGGLISSEAESIVDSAASAGGNSFAHSSSSFSIIPPLSSNNGGVAGLFQQTPLKHGARGVMLPGNMSFKREFGAGGVITLYHLDGTVIKKFKTHEGNMDELNGSVQAYSVIYWEFHLE